MARFVWRSFILMVIFTSGLLVGNIFTPKQILQEKDIVGIVEVKTSLDLQTKDNFITLAQSQDITEIYTAFLRQSYKAAKLEYEAQLQNVTKNPQDQKDFIKAKKDYIAIANYIEQNYPVIQEELSIPEQEEKTEDLTQEETKQKQIEEILTEQATKQENIET